MYYSLVSLADEWETSFPEALEYSPVLISFNPATAGQATELVGNTYKTKTAGAKVV